MTSEGKISFWTLVIASIMVGIGIFIGGVAVYISAPVLLRYEATEAYLSTQNARLDERGQLLSATQAELDVRALSSNTLATESALHIQRTQVALNNNQALLAQTATQLAQQIVATQTANAVQNQQQMTQVAFDYRATQLVLELNATQAEQNFRATQAALITPSVSSAPALVSSVTPAPTVSLTPTATLPRAFITRTFTFSNGIDDRVFSSAPAWVARAVGVTTTQEGAWLLTQQPIWGDFALEIAFTPAVVEQAFYDFLLNANSTDALLVRVVALNLEATTVSVYRYTGNLPAQPTGQALAEVTFRLPMTATTRLKLTNTNNLLTLVANDRDILMTPLGQFSPSGIIGVQFPLGTTLTELSITASEGR